MKRSLKILIGFTMRATDGELGNVIDIYFDDEIWLIRYLIVESGNGRLGRKVLISPEALLVPDWNTKVFPTNLTKAQIASSPDIDTDKSVSRQQEIKLYEHYPWTGRKFGGAFDGGLNPLAMGFPMTESIKPVLETQENNTFEDPDNNPHLISVLKVMGYTIHTSDGKLGTLADFIIDDSNWNIDFLVIDSCILQPGKKVTISPNLITEIKWDTSEVFVNATAEQIKNSPEYETSLSVNEVIMAKM